MARWFGLMGALFIATAFFATASPAQAEVVSLKLKLTQPDGVTAMSSVYVYAWGPGYTPYYSAYTGTDGIARFYDMSVGAYTVQISKPWDSTTSAPANFSVDITANATTDVGVVKMQSGNVTGCLLGSDGGAVKSQYVSISSDSWTRTDYGYTNDQGCFKLNMRSKGSYKIMSYDNSAYKFLWPGDVAVTLATDDQAVDVGNIKSAIANITGTFADKNGNPISNAGISLFNSGWTYSRWTNTNAQGKFEVYAPNGDYAVRFSGYNSGNDPADRSLTVTNPSTVIDLGTIKQLGVSVTVILKDPNGNAVSGATVHMNDSAYQYYRYKITDSNGRAEFSPTSTGTYTISSYNYNTSSTYSNPKPYSLSFTIGDTLEVNLTLRDPGMLLDVKDPNGNLLSGASVSVGPEGSYSWGEDTNDLATTDSNGRARIKPLKTGKYKLSIYYYNYSATSIEQWVAPSTITADLVEGTQHTSYTGSGAIKFSTPKKIFKGKITDQKGNPIADASLYGSDSSNWSRSFNAQTDGEGNFSTKMGGGKYTISVWPRSWPSEWGFTEPNATIEFKDDETSETVTKNYKVEKYLSKIIGTVQYGDGSTPPSTDYVSIYASNSEKNFWGYAQVTDGKFEIKSPEGSFSVSGYTGNSTYASPSAQTISVLDEKSFNMGKVIFPKKEEKIEVSVVDTTGAAVSGASVSAWQDGGSSNYAWSTTGTDGKATMNVTQGPYKVRADFWSWFSTDSTQKKYASIEGPKEVELTAKETETVTITLGIITSKAEVSIVDSAGALVSGYNGWLDVATSATTDQYSYSGLGSQVQGGKGTVHLPAGSWKFKIYGWNGDWSVSGDPTLTIGENETKTVEVSVAKNNSTIKGSFVDADGKTLTDLSGWVNGTNGSGTYVYSNLNQGEYSFKVAKDDWELSASTWGNIDYVIAPDQEMKVSIGENEEKTFNVKFLKNDSSVKVIVLDPDGKPKANASISLETKVGKGKVKQAGSYWYGMQEYERTSDQNGEATVKAPAGTYYVTSSVPLELGWMNPKAVAVEMKKGETAEVTLEFRKADSKIEGTLTLNNAPVDGTIYAYSDDGSAATGGAGNDGKYTININSGEGEDETRQWFVSAVSGETVTATKETFYETKSETQVNADKADTTYAVDLALNATPKELPPSETTTLDANTQGSIALADGTELVLPANSTTTTDVNVSVTIDPTAEVPKTADDYPLEGMGYQIDVVKASGSSVGEEIVNLASPVTLTMIYTDKDLTAAGVDEQDITIKTWDEEKGNWSNVDSVILNEETNSLTCTTRHFTVFAITTSGSKVAATGSSGVIPTVSISSPNDQATISIPQLILEGTSSDAKAEVTIKLNDQSVGGVEVSSQGGFSKTITGLAIGENTISVTAKNSVGTSPKVTRTVSYEPVTAGGGDGSGDDQPSTIATGINRHVVTFKKEGSSEVQIHDAQGKLKKEFQAFAKEVTGSYQLLVADLDGNGSEEILVATGKGLAPYIRVFSREGKSIANLYAYEKNGKMGTKFLLADLTGDKLPELITRPVSKAASTVKVFQYKSGQKKFVELTSALVYAKKFTSGMKVIASDVTGDGAADLIFSPEEAGAPEVRVYSLQTKGKKKLNLVDNFHAFDKTRKMGVKVFASDISGDGKNDLVVLPSTEGATTLNYYQYNSSKKKFELGDKVYPYGKSYKGEVNARIADVNGDEKVDVIVVPHNKRGPEVKIYSYNKSGGKWLELASFNGFAKKFKGGVDLVITNMDKDDYPEIALTPRSGSQPQLRLYEYNPTKKTFKLQDSLLTHPKSLRSQLEVTSADLDGNGDSELIVSSQASSPVVNIVDWNAKKGLVSSTTFTAFGSGFKAGVKTATIAATNVSVSKFKGKAPSR